MKFAVMPHTTRNKDNNNMGMTQPIFPKVGDKLGQTVPSWGEHTPLVENINAYLCLLRLPC